MATMRVRLRVPSAGRHDGNDNTLLYRHIGLPHNGEFLELNVRGPAPLRLDAYYVNTASHIVEQDSGHVLRRGGGRGQPLYFPAGRIEHSNHDLGDPLA